MKTCFYKQLLFIITRILDYKSSLHFLFLLWETFSALIVHIWFEPTSNTGLFAHVNTAYTKFNVKQLYNITWHCVWIGHFCVFTLLM